MIKPCLLAVVDDLYFQSQIQGIAVSKQIEVYFATQGAQLVELAKTIAPFMMVADLSERESEWVFRHISEIVSDKPDFPIAVFISHLQQDVRERAEKYGCRFIFTKSEFVRRFPETVEQCLRKGF